MALRDWFRGKPSVATPGDIGLSPEGRILVSPSPRRMRMSKRMYAAARVSRLTADFQASNTSADTELVSSLTTMRARSRALCRDVGQAKRAKQLVVNGVIGTGIGMQAQVYTTREELNARVNDEIESVWREWSCAEYCHTGGRYDFSTFERNLMAQVFEAGEVFVRKHYRSFGGSAVPYALELIEAERLADEFMSPHIAAQQGTQIRMGVEVDDFFRPVAYHIRQRHPSEFQFSHGRRDMVERVPASQIVHLSFGDRFPQTRGEPWMAAVIRTIRDVAGYIEAEITRARIQASTPWTIETPEDAISFADDDEEGAAADGELEMTVEAGVAKRLNPGEKMNVPATNSPNSAAEPFLRVLLRDFASGCGINYASLSGDHSQSNYSSSRLALLDDRDTWRAFQAWFISSFRLPVHREWMQQAVLSGAFTTFSVEAWALDQSKFEAVRFRPRGWGWVDPTKEVQAFKDAVRCGFMTQADVLAQSGTDMEELIEQRKKEVELADEAGLVFDTDPRVEASKAQTPQPPADAATPDQPATNPDEPAIARVLSFQR